jgi:hypothetical protein
MCRVACHEQGHCDCGNTPACFATLHKTPDQIAYEHISKLKADDSQIFCCPVKNCAFRAKGTYPHEYDASMVSDEIYAHYYADHREDLSVDARMSVSECDGAGLMEAIELNYIHSMNLKRHA